MFYFVLDAGEHPRTGCRRACAVAKFTRFDLHPLPAPDDTPARVELSATCRSCGGDFAWRGVLRASAPTGRWSVELPRVGSPRLGAALHPKPRR